jgi:hypothetical protein
LGATPRDPNRALPRLRIPNGLCAPAHPRAQVGCARRIPTFYYFVTAQPHPTAMPYPYNIALAAGLMLIVLSSGLALVLT